MKRLRRHRRFLGWFMIVLMLFGQPQPVSQAAILFWAPGGIPNDGGGANGWNTTDLDWGTTVATGGTAWNNATVGGDIAVFGNVAVAGSIPAFLTVTNPIVLNGLRFDQPNMILQSGEEF